MNAILNLWKKNLGQVPSSVWDDTSLEALVLADNGLKDISERLGQLRNLRMLDLGHNQLSAIPETIGEIVGLSDYLYLHDNMLSSLPSSIGRLRKLRYLNISENAFSELPESVCAISGLIELRVTDNQLTSIPDCIGQLSRLRELHLRNNSLITLPSVISRLVEIRLSPCPRKLFVCPNWRSWIYAGSIRCTHQTGLVLLRSAGV